MKPLDADNPPTWVVLLAVILVTLLASAIVGASVAWGRYVHDLVDLFLRGR